MLKKQIFFLKFVSVINNGVLFSKGFRVHDLLITRDRYNYTLSLIIYKRFGLQAKCSSVRRRGLQEYKAGIPKVDKSALREVCLNVNANNGYLIKENGHESETIKLFILELVVL